MTKTKLYFICVPCGLAGLLITFLVLNLNYVQSPQLPQKKVLLSIEGEHYEIPVIQKHYLKDADASLKKLPKCKKIVMTNVLFHWNPTFMVWTMLIVLLMTICSACCPASIIVLQWMKKEYNISRRSRRFAWASTAVFIGIMIVIFLTTTGYYKPSEIVRDFGVLLTSPWIMYGLATLPIFLISPLITIFFLIPFITDGLKFQAHDRLSIEPVFVQHFKLDSILQNSLYVMAIVVAFTLFCSSALRESIKETLEFYSIDIFAKEISYVYGLFYTIFLAILYVPAELILRLHYQDMKDTLATNNVGGKWLEDLYEKNKQETSIWDKSKVILTIFSPLMSSFLPELLDKI